MESHEAGFPPFPPSVEIPSGLPHFHGLDDWVYVFSCPLYSNHRYRKGLVTDVSGPQRNACPGTLNGKERGRPLRAALIFRRRLRLSTATLSHEPTVKASRTSRLLPTLAQARLTSSALTISRQASASVGTKRGVIRARSTGSAERWP
jgi:hypothetical protein